MAVYGAAVLVLAAASLVPVAVGFVLTVGNSSISLTDALEKVTSDTVIYLESGKHQIDRFILFQDLSDVSIIGRTTDIEVEEVIVTCATNVGLAFVNASDITLTNFRVVGCGLSSGNLVQTVAKLREIVDVFHRIPSDTYVGLFLGHCTNVVMQNMAVTNTTGLGMLGINVIGSSRLSEVDFTDNIRLDDCLQTASHGRQIGGGAIFAYFDYFGTDFNHTVILDIEQANFIRNSECTEEPHYIYGKDSMVLYDECCTLDGGGGLSLIMFQQLYGVVVRVDSTLFKNNTAWVGGGALVSIYAGVFHTWVTFSNCTVLHNGFLLEESFSLGAAGIAIVNDIRRPDPSLELEFILIRNVSVIIHDTDFIENSARIGGGAAILSSFISPVTNNLYATHVSFNNCIFDGNVARSGSALFVNEIKLNGRYPGIQVAATTIIVRNNLQEYSSHLFPWVPAAVTVVAVKFTIQGNSVIDSNSVTAMSCYSSLINLTGNITLMRNIGVYGGGLYLTQSSRIVLSQDSSIRFIENVGQGLGGAIYVYYHPLYDRIPTPSCSIFFNYLDSYFCRDCLNFSGIYMEFSHNKAQYGGIIYGISLEDCPWAIQLRTKLQLQSSQVEKMNILQILQMYYPNNFKIDPEPHGVTQVRTPSTSLHISEKQYNYLGIPGQTLFLRLSAIDRFKQNIASVVTSYSTSTSPDATLLLGSNGYFTLRGEEPTLTKLTVYAPPNQTVNATFFTLDSDFFAQARISVNTQNCPYGFEYNHSSRICECDDYLKKKKIQCISNNSTFIVPRDTWLGPLSSDGELAVEPCLMYCNREEKIVKIVNGTADYDSQCATGQNRSGVGCGSCRDGYSLAIGSNKCLRCSNVHVLLLLIFIAFGIGLVAIIAYLRITVAYGFLNGVLFYCNIVSLYGPQLTPSEPYSGRLAFAAFLTLNFGIESCFHDNMSALKRVTWQLVFPLYLFILMLVIAGLARIMKFQAIKGQNIIQAFSTLILLVYVSVLQASVDILSFVTYHTAKGSHHLWKTDPSVTYYHGVHGFLATVAILLVLLYIIPFPLLLFFPSLLYRNNRLGKFKPFYDALWNPFKSTYRRWLSIRLVFRWIPSILVVFIDSPQNTVATGMIVIIQMFLLMLVKPFQSKWVNISDGLLLLNLSLLFIGTLYYDAMARSATDDSRAVILHNSTAFSTALVILAYCQFIAIFFYHLVIRFAQLQKLLQTLVSTLRRSRLGKKLCGELVEEISTKHQLKAEKDSAASNNNTTFSELREPCLEAEGIELAPISTQGEIK